MDPVLQGISNSLDKNICSKRIFSRFGVCCVFTIKDPTSAEITQNDTYLQNPGFSSNYKETNNVKYTVNKVSPGILINVGM